MTEMVHVRAIASNRVHLLDISDHSVYVWRDADEEFYRHDDRVWDSPSYRVVAFPARPLCGAKLGNKATKVVVMRGWDPAQVCRTCKRLSDE